MKGPLLPKLALSCLLLTAAAATKAQPVKVEISQNDGGFVLKRDHKPYFIKGAGGTSYTDRLAKYGGNSIRTWSTYNGGEVLAKADSLGLTVTMGLDVARERHGFNYDDTTAVHNQLERLRAEVIRYRNSPALLMWGVGNELNLDYKNPKVWNAVNDIAKMIHQEDPNHPVTTMLAGVNPLVVNAVISRCPDLDLLAVQVYGGLAKVPASHRGGARDPKSTGQSRRLPVVFIRGRWQEQGRYRKYPLLCRKPPSTINPPKT